MAGAKSILKRFSSSAFSVLVARLMAFIAVFGFNAVLARSLAPEEFGVFALLYSLATLTSLVASFGMNRALDSSVETVFLMAEAKHQAIASKLVKEIARLGGDVSKFVTPMVNDALLERFG